MLPSGWLLSAASKGSSHIPSCRTLYEWTFVTWALQLFSGLIKKKFSSTRIRDFRRGKIKRPRMAGLNNILVFTTSAITTYRKSKGDQISSKTLAILNIFWWREHEREHARVRYRRAGSNSIFEQPRLPNKLIFSRNLELFLFFSDRLFIKFHPKTLKTSQGILGNLFFIRARSSGINVYLGDVHKLRRTFFQILTSHVNTISKNSLV